QTRRRYTDINQVEKILKERTRETFKIEGISKIFYDNNNKLSFSRSNLF
ncbi:unnamed protein product, partial [marine sediment metagenome]